MDKFEIVTGRQNSQSVANPKHAGLSIYKEAENFYKLHLNILPNITYFMKKNESNGFYTIFSQKLNDDGKIKLQKPVGQGRIICNLKTHMKIYLDAFNMTLYMSLFPKC